jgi:hypothetical protein
MRADSKDPRQKSTPRVEEHKGDFGWDVDYHETHEDTEEESKIPEESNLIYYDAEVVQHIHITRHIPADQVIAKLQAGNKEIHEAYAKWLENKKNFMKTVYPSVIHSAISSPKNSIGGFSGAGNLYWSPDDNSSNPRSSNKDNSTPRATAIGPKSRTGYIDTFLENALKSNKEEVSFVIQN